MKSAAVFLCYARKDNEDPDPKARWLDRLREHLDPLLGHDELWTFSDNDIRAGERWHDRIQRQLEGVRAAVLLVSPSFLASQYVRDHELPKLLGRAQEGGVELIPVFLRPCVVARLRFRYPDPRTGPGAFDLTSLQGIGSPKRSLIQMTYAEQELALVGLAERVQELVLSQTEGAVAVVVGATQPEPSGALVPPAVVVPVSFRSDSGFENMLGMRVVRVPGVQPRFSVWPTRVADSRAFVEATGYDATKGMFSPQPGRVVRPGWERVGMVRRLVSEGDKQ